MIIEAGLLHASEQPRSQGQYTFEDTWASIGAGGVQRIFFKVVVAPTVGSAPYFYVHHMAQEQWGVPKLTIFEAWYGGIVALVLVDLAY